MSTEAIKISIPTYVREMGPMAAVAPRTEDSAAVTKPSAAAIDTVDFSPLALRASELSRKAKAMDGDVNFAQVSAFKQALETGTYPAPLVVEGLLKLVGQSIKDVGNTYQS
jgi:anti-sigma28 factor (negative regulator of flagellin synthesis)